MAAETAAASDQIIPSASKTRRDYRLSLAFAVAGLVIVVASYSSMYWAEATGHYPGAAFAVLVLGSLAGIGEILIIVGAIFAGINWSLLRKRHLGN